MLVMTLHQRQFVIIPVSGLFEAMPEAERTGPLPGQPRKAAAVRCDDPEISSQARPASNSTRFELLTSQTLTISPVKGFPILYPPRSAN